MNSKAVKKLRQLYKRDLRNKLGVDKSILEAMLIGKPKRIPRWLWTWGARFYFAPEFYKKLFRPHK